MEPVIAVRSNAQGKGLDSMKNIKWEMLDLQDVRKGMQVACCADGMSPKGHVLNKIKDVLKQIKYYLNIPRYWYEAYSLPSKELINLFFD